MKISRIFIPILSLSAILASCQEEPDLTSEPEPAAMEGYYFRISGIGQAAEPASRVSYPTYVESRFDSGDRVGIFTLDDSGKAVQSNLSYCVEEKNGAQALKEEGEKAFEGSDYRYLIYYPYSASMTLDRLKSLVYTVSDAQADGEDADGLTEYEKSDLLWDLASVAVDDAGKPKTDSEGNQFVDVVMDHVMATVIIRIRNGFEEMAPVLCPTFERTVTGGIDLTAAPTVDALRSRLFPEDAASPLAYRSEDRSEISMWKVDLSEDDIVQSYSRAYRAAVPPQTLQAGQQIVTIGGRSFKYSGEPMQLQPGKRYTFFIKDPSKPFVDIDDDDTWIFDVVDPLTGEKVGLLCREYIRYQPNRMTSRNDNFTILDQITGVPVAVTLDDGTTIQTKTISSQVWVYYDLWKFAKKKNHDLEDEFMRNARNQNDMKNDDDPYLDSGIALRFIYDVRYCGDAPIVESSEERAAAGYDPDEQIFSNENKMWPAPHVGIFSSGGLFLAKHGQMWTKSKEGNWGGSSGNQHEFWMHGGKVYWGCYQWAESGFKFNAVKLFVMPDEQVKTDVACQYGHINIIRDHETKEIIGTEVSYDPYLTSDVNVGVLIPKYINDSRNAEEGVITYPLVKIGYNNIWSKKGLRTRYYNDGEKMECYQRSRGEFDFPHIFKWSGGTYDTNEERFLDGLTYWPGNFNEVAKFDIPGSYAYAFNQYFNVYDYLSTFAPESAGLGNAARHDEEMKFTKLYNCSTIYQKDRLVPRAGTYDARMSCYIPRMVRFYELFHYVGSAPGIKLMTNHLMPRILDKVYTADDYANALKNQEFVTTGLQQNMNSYSSNVAGMDFRAIGLLRPQNGKSMISAGFNGGGGYGTLVSFWMDGDPTYTPFEKIEYLKRDDAICFIQQLIWNGWSTASWDHVSKDNFKYIDENGTIDGFGVTEKGIYAKAYLRSRMYCAVRPVLKFNHQNGPNPHERTTEQAVSTVKGFVKAMTRKPSAGESPSRVSASGTDVVIELDPVVGQ